jgi:hypothetical protein
MAGLIFDAREAHCCGDMRVPYVSGESCKKAEMVMAERASHIPARAKRGIVESFMIPERIVQDIRTPK